MANFEYAFASSGTPNSFAVGASGITGVDEAGTLTPVVFELGTNVTVLLTAVKTNAELVALMQAFIARYGAGHEGAGGYKAQATLQRAPALTTVGAAD